MTPLASYAPPRSPPAIPSPLSCPLSRQVRAAAWRLAAQQDAFIALGYRFLLQHGDDALVAKKIERNVVKTMADAKAVMGGAHRSALGA